MSQFEVWRRRVLWLRVGRSSRPYRLVAMALGGGLVLGCLWAFGTYEVRVSGRPAEGWNTRENQLYIVRKLNPFGLRIETGWWSEDLSESGRVQLRRGFSLGTWPVVRWERVGELLQSDRAGRFLLASGHREEAIETLLAAMTSRDSRPYEKDAAARALVELAEADAEVLPALNSARKSHYAKARAADLAASLLGAKDALAIDAAAGDLWRRRRESEGGLDRLLERAKLADPEVVRQLQRRLMGTSHLGYGSFFAVADPLVGTAEERSMLAKALGDIHPETAAAAARAPASPAVADPRVRQDLLATLRRGDLNFGSPAAARALGQLGRRDPEVIQGLMAALRSHDVNNDETASAAAIALRQLGRSGPAVIQRMATVIRGASPGTWDAVAVLGHIGHADPLEIEALSVLLQEARPEEAPRVAALLCQLGRSDPLAIRALLAELGRKGSFLGAPAVASVLGHLETPDPEVVQALLMAIRSNDANLTLAAANSLALLGKGVPEVSRSLLTVVQSGAPVSSLAAAIALGELGHADPSVIRCLVAHFELGDDSRDIDLRRGAILAFARLATVHPEVAVEEGVAAGLRRALCSLHLRDDARRALGQLGQARRDWTDERLLVFLEDHRSVWRDTGAAVIEGREHISRELAAGLDALRSDERPWVRAVAWDTYTRIRRRAPATPLGEVPPASR